MPSKKPLPKQLCKPLHSCGVFLYDGGIKKTLVFLTPLSPLCLCLSQQNAALRFMRVSRRKTKTLRCNSGSCGHTPSIARSPSRMSSLIMSAAPQASGRSCRSYGRLHAHARLIRCLSGSLTASPDRQSN